ncbi:MAG: exopolysaccharide biosynthesis protein [Dongiaceae bacterium]
MNDTAAETLRARPQRVSELLEQLARTWPGERISLGDITRLLGDRGYGVLMLILALPGLLPGISSIAAVPLALVALQLAIGLPRPWLPRFLANRSLSRADFSRMIERALPYIARIERLLRPRLSAVAGPVGERVMGLACLALALLLTIPILFNMPLVVPIALMALAILERDGVLAAVGLLAGCLALGAVVGIGWVSLQEGLQLAGKYLGM